MGSPIAELDNEVLLNQMTSCLAGSGGNPKIAITPNSNLGCIGGRDNNGLFESEDLMIAIVGDMYWVDPDLCQASSSQGLISVFAERYKQQGRSILEMLHGSFAVAIVEPRKGKALIAVDRLGIQALAYTTVGDQFIFASQITAIVKHPSVSGKIDSQSIFAYLYFHMVPSPDTINQGISKLLPGQYLEFDRGAITHGFYWQPHYQERSVRESMLVDELHNELESAIQRCVDSNDSTGVFLSGGLDSSTVTGIFRKLSGQKIDAFVIGFDAEGYDEMEFARASARHFDVNLIEYYLTPDDVVDALPMIANAYDEPFGNASAVPAYYCAKLARDHGKTCLLAGDGGDELFAGNERYAKQKIFELYGHVPGALRQVIEPLANATPFLGKLKSYIEQANIPLPDRMETYNFLHRTPAEDVLHPDFLCDINTAKPLLNLQEVYARAQTESIVKRMLFLDLKFTLADNDLRKVNRMCEAAGISVRYPLLDDNIVDFSARVPSQYLMRRFEIRSFFRRALANFLAPETLSKSKHGFGLPFGLWLNEHHRLKDFANESLTSLRKRNILNPRYLDDIIKNHQTGHAAYYGVMIWILMMLEQWLQVHEY